MIGTMGLAAVERVIPTGMCRPASPRLTIGTRSVTWRSIAVVEAPILALLALIFAFSVAVTPDFHLRLTGWALPHPSLDPFFLLTGIPCLLCGMTRSFLSMGSLDIGQAFVFHPLGPFVYFGLAFIGAGMTLAIASRRRLHIEISRNLSHRLLTWSAVIVLAAWVLKIIVWRHAGLL